MNIYFHQIIKELVNFTDLSLIVISERLNISEIATLDKDFDVYRRYRKKPFNRVFFPQR